MTILQNDVKRHFLMHEAEYTNAALKVLKQDSYILGKNVEEFEKRFANFEHRKYCVSCANGFDALFLAFNALGISEGDEVLLAANAYIACANAVCRCGAKPVFADCGGDFLINVEEIEKNITDKTKAILAVHLYGKTCDMDGINKIAEAHNLYVVEDCAQSHGSRYKGNISGSMSDAACFSFYPTKNMGCFGDGGCVVTDNKEIAQNIKITRNYGKNEKGEFVIKGVNSRLDELQAAFLNVKLNYIDEINFARKHIALRYINEIKNKNIILPEYSEGHVWHQFAIKCKKRDLLKKYLEQREIMTLIHYDTPIYLTDAYKEIKSENGKYPLTEEFCASELSLPIFEGMTEGEISEVIKAVNDFE